MSPVRPSPPVTTAESGGSRTGASRTASSLRRPLPPRRDPRDRRWRRTQHEGLPRPRRRRADQPWGTLVRHLLAAPEGADRVPPDPDRRQRRQPHHLPPPTPPP